VSERGDGQAHQNRDRQNFDPARDDYFGLADELNCDHGNFSPVGDDVASSIFSGPDRFA
jgi:hypothetical protein